jgi:hypothetical protein
MLIVTFLSTYVKMSESIYLLRKVKSITVFQFVLFVIIIIVYHYIFACFEDCSIFIYLIFLVIITYRKVHCLLDMKNICYVQGKELDLMIVGCCMI